MANNIDKKCHIVHVVQSLDVGGMENGIVNLANTMDKKRFQITICCLSHFGSLSNMISDKSVSLVCMGWKDGVDFSLFKKLATKFKELKVDVVHTHGWLSFLYGAVACKLSGGRVLINGEHGTFNLTKVRRRITYKILSYFVDTFLTVSSSLRNELITSLRIDGKNIVTIPNGVDSCKFSPKTDSEIMGIKQLLGIPETALVIGSVGRLEPVKNYEMLIHSFNELTKNYPSLYCLLIGDGSCRSGLESLAEHLGVKGKVVFIGKVGDPQNLLPIMDIFVLTSKSEGMSNTILEAMSCGIPIVATNVGGTNEIVRNEFNGYLVESGNISMLRDRISHLLADNTMRKTCGVHSRRIIDENFDLKVMVARYEDVYLKATSRV